MKGLLCCDIRKQNCGEKNFERLIIIVVLWILAFFYYCVISWFSGKAATESSLESGIITKKIVEILATTTKIENNPHTFSMVQFIVRKLAHFYNFFVFGFLCIMLSAVLHRNLYAATVAGLICGLAGAYIDEWHQLYIPGRSGEIMDVCVDFGGVGFGCLIFVCSIFLFRKRK